jgi:hypothetical protein
MPSRINVCVSGSAVWLDGLSFEGDELTEVKIMQTNSNVSESFLNATFHSQDEIAIVQGERPSGDAEHRVPRPFWDPVPSEMYDRPRRQPVLENNGFCGSTLGNR